MNKSTQKDKPINNKFQLETGKFISNRDETISGTVQSTISVSVTATSFIPAIVSRITG
jgi:hypothetical protein